MIISKALVAESGVQRACSEVGRSLGIPTVVKCGEGGS